MSGYCWKGIIACASYNVSCLGAGSFLSLIVMLDMWYKYWGDDTGRSSSRSLDRSDEKFPRSKTKDFIMHSLAVASNHGALTFTAGVSLAGPLWGDILRQKVIGVRQRRPCRLNLPSVVVLTDILSAVLVGVAVVLEG